MLYTIENGELVKVPIFVKDSRIDEYLHGGCIFHYNYDYDIGYNECEYLKGLIDAPCDGCPNHP